jgi:hypothetical protein
MRPGGGLTTRRTVGAWIAAVAAAGGAFALGATEPDPPPAARPAPVAALPDAPGTVRLPPSAERPQAPPVALTPSADGLGLLWAERGTGVVRRAPLAGTTVGPGEVLARLDVAPGPAFAVRGLAVGRDGRIYAAYVRARDRRLVVSEISRPQPRIVWRGPLAGRARVGGGLLALPGGRLVVGVGDQARPGRAATAASVLGRVVTLDPDGRGSQEPRRRSRGWHDPVALARGRAGELWVADRAGAGEAERIGRAGRPGGAVVRSGFRRVPVAMAASADGRALLVCGLRSGRIDRTPVLDDGTGPPRPQADVLDARCRYGMTRTGGRLWASGDDGSITAVGTEDELLAAPALED